MRNIGKFFLRVLPVVIAFAAVFAFKPEKINAVSYGWEADFQRFTGENGEKYYKSSNYKVKIYDGNGGFSYHGISGGTEVRRFELVHEMTGERKPAYCIAPGLAYTWLNIYNTDMGNDSAFRTYFNALPETARKGISYALMFGYKGDGVCSISGANAGDYWVATQAVIWEYQQGIRTDPYSRQNSGLVDADIFYNIVRGKSAEKCYSYILSSIADYTSPLSFCSADASGAVNTYTLNETYQGTGEYQAFLINSNTSAGKSVCAVNESGERLSYISVTNSGPSYVIRSTKAINEPEVIKLVPLDTYMSENTAYFFTGGEGEQPLVSCGNIEDPFCQYIKIETKAASSQYFTLNVRKVEENGNISGVPFLFSWSTGAGTVQRIVSTDENGIASVRVPTGYSPESLSGILMYVSELGDSGYTAAASAGTGCTLINTVYFYQTALTGWAYNSDHSTALSLGGGTAHIGWCIFPNYVSYGNVVNMTVTNVPDTGTLRLVKSSETDTDEQFAFLIEGLDMNNSHIHIDKTLASPSRTDCVLPVGRYRISEILPDGSRWMTPDPQIVTVVKGTVSSAEFINSLKKGSILIEKRSEDNDFEGISFCVSLSDGSFMQNMNAEEGEGVTEYDEELVLELFESGLNAGTYTVTEYCPDKYVPQREVTVVVRPGETACVNFNNILKRGDVMLVKNDRDSNNPVEGAFYTLYRSDGTVVSERLVTDENGCIRVGNLTLGSYYFLEDEAPSGYMLNREKAEFSVSSDNYGSEQVLRVTDKSLTGSICITKRIRRDEVVLKHGRPVFSFTVSGVSYDGNTHVYVLYVEFTEDDLESGSEYAEKSVMLSDIPAGNYSVCEKETFRYEIGSVSVNTGNASLSDGNILWMPTEQDRNLHVTFSNRKTDNSGLSHTDLVVNEIGGGT